MDTFAVHYVGRNSTVERSGLIKRVKLNAPEGYLPIGPVGGPDGAAFDDGIFPGDSHKFKFAMENTSII